MKLTIEVNSEHISSLEDWLVLHGGIVTSREEPGDVVNVSVVNGGKYYIRAIREFRELTGWGLLESKRFVQDAMPRSARFSKETALAIREKLGAVGAIVLFDL